MWTPQRLKEKVREAVCQLQLGRAKGEPGKASMKERPDA
jgi:hypothetical protein